MAIPLEFISNSAKDMESSPLFLPPGVDLAVKCIKTVYGMWRWRKDYEEIYSNSDGAVQYGIGVVLNKLIGNSIASLPLEVVARIALISKCFAESIQEYKNTCYSWYSLAKAVKEHHFCTVKIDCRTIVSTHYTVLEIIFDPAFLRWLEVHANLAFLKIKTVAKYVFLFGTQIFDVSMCSIQLTEAVLFNPETRNDAMNRIWVNWALIFKKTAENEEELLDILYRNREATNHLLKKFCRLPCTADDLINVTRRAINLAKTCNAGSNKVTNKIKEGAKVVGKFIYFGIFDRVPDWLKSEETAAKLSTKITSVQCKSMPFIQGSIYPTVFSIRRIQERSQMRQAG